jgi:hypothetical protein
MMAQPFSQAFGLGIRQKIDNRVAFQIDKDCPLAASAPPRPVIDGKHARDRPRLGNTLDSLHQPQQRVRADRHGQPLGQTHSDFAAQRQSKMTLQVT